MTVGLFIVPVLSLLNSHGEKDADEKSCEERVIHNLVNKTEDALPATNFVVNCKG